MEFLIGRQAILDRRKRTFGYELLYREDITNNSSSSNLSGNAVTNRVIINAFLNLGINRIAKKGRVFINFTKDLIVQKLYKVLPKDKMIIEVLEDVLAEESVIASLKDAKNQGYTVALDDFVFAEEKLELVELADIIKIDFLEMSKEDIKKEVKKYKKYYNVKLLAEKIEDEDIFKFALNLGFDYFQGFFFQKPTIEAKNDIAPYQMSILRALSMVNNPKSSMEELIELISGDVYLHTKILAFVNSPFFGLKKRVDKIKNAVYLLGMNTVREWLNIMYISKLSERRPEELIVLSTVRAKFAHFLSKYFFVEANNAYLLGMFSLMDSLLNLPMEIVLEECNYLSDDLKAALKGEDNNCKKLLDFIKMFENGDFDSAYEAMNILSLSIADVNNYYLKALEFADNIYNL